MHSRGDILIDDFERNTTAWKLEGGFAILHLDFETTRDELENEIVRRGKAYI